MTITKSRYCRRCDAQFRFQCSCPNHMALAWQRRNVFHSGKRHKGKDAWKEVHLTDENYKKEDENDYL